MYLSKSKFVAGHQCLKRLYLQIREPDLAGEASESTQAVMKQGHEVGRWAQKIFPGGLLIKAGHEELGKAIEQTEQAVARKHLPAVFEATFVHDRVLARVDILERLPGDRWRLIEVKSSTSLKDYYLYDVAIQRFILEGRGMKVVPCLMHLNREYVYDGEQYNLKQLFIIRDVTDQTKAIEQEVKDLIREERKILARATPPRYRARKPLYQPFYLRILRPLQQAPAG